MIPPTIADYVGTSEFTHEPYEIQIDLSRDLELPEASKISFKEDKYMVEGETSPQQALARASVAYASNKDHAQRLYDYASKQWFSYASPVLASAGNARGCPVSCFLGDIGDSRHDIADSWREMLWLATEGGGVGYNYSKVRSVGSRTSRGTSTPGLMSFLGVADSITKTSIQGEVRRGASAIYLDVSHPEIVTFIESRKVGGDSHRKLFNMHNAVNISDAFMVAVEKGEKWDLVDPHDKRVTAVVDARELWDRILKTRVETGEPYLHFSDTSNKFLPQALKDKGLRINGSNLCCVAEDQLVTTKEFGVKTARELYDLGELCHVRGSSGDWIKTRTPMRLLGRDRDLVRITVESGASHDVTEDHKIPVVRGFSWVLKEAQDVRAGDLLLVYDEATGLFTETMVMDADPIGTGDAFCWEVDSDDHLWVCNGFLTHNCEIMLPTSPERTAVCILSSVNLEFFNEWSKEDLFISDLIEMLDNVTSVFIEKAPADLAKAVSSAKSERSVGLGAMGFHLYLQQQGIPFESAMASSANRRIFSYIQEKALKANHRLGHERGEAPDLETKLTFTYEDGKQETFSSSAWLHTSRGQLRAAEVAEGETVGSFSRAQWEFEGGVVTKIEGKHSHSGRRLSHMQAIAPNASSAILCGLTSPSIEPFNSNIILQKKSRFSFVIKNKELDKLFQSKYSLKGKQLDDAWNEVLRNSGSVQSLSFMDDSDKEVFKTAREIDQSWVIEHASVRQQFICQGQSVNLFLPKTISMSYLRGLHKAAWKKGLKGLYYIRGESSAAMSGTSGKALVDPMSDCLSCSG
jgi:ribonucleotide reductase alpha subunit